MPVLEFQRLPSIRTHRGNLTSGTLFTKEGWNQCWHVSAFGAAICFYMRPQNQNPSGLLPVKVFKHMFWRRKWFGSSKFFCPFDFWVSLCLSLIYWYITEFYHAWNSCLSCVQSYLSGGFGAGSPPAGEAQGQWHSFPSSQLKTFRADWVTLKLRQRTDPRGK